MNEPNDPLFDRIRALPRAEVSGHVAARVERLALAALADQREHQEPFLPRRVLAAIALGGAMAGYFGWAVVFVLWS